MVVGRIGISGSELWRFCGCWKDLNIWIRIVEVLWLLEGLEYLGPNVGDFIADSSG